VLAGVGEDASVRLGWGVNESEKHMVQEVLPVVVDRLWEPKTTITLCDSIV